MECIYIHSSQINAFPTQLVRNQLYKRKNILRKHHRLRAVNFKFESPERPNELANYTNAIIRTSLAYLLQTLPVSFYTKHVSNSVIR